MRLRLAHHVIIIERLATVTDEEGGTEEWGGGGADFFDGGDGWGEGGCVNEDLLVESRGGVSWYMVRVGKGKEEVYFGWRAAIVEMLIVGEGDWEGG